jgi:hypothetical protein
MNNTEQWKPILGFEGFYEISSQGRVRSVDRIIHDRLRDRLLKGKIIVAGLDSKHLGYKHCTLYKEGKAVTIKVHRLVAQAFIPNPNNYPIINHKDYNPSNNNVENLEWCTYKYNSNYGNIGEKRGTKIAQLGESGEILRVFGSVREAARLYGVHDTAIFHAIERGQRGGGHRWKRL